MARNKNGTFSKGADATRKAGGGGGRTGGGAGLAQAIRSYDASSGESKLMAFAWRIFEGKEPGATLEDKQWAFDRLLNRAYGREAQVTLNGELGEGQNPLAEVPTETLVEALKARSGASKPQATTQTLHSVEPQALTPEEHTSPGRRRLQAVGDEPISEAEPES